MRAVCEWIEGEGERAGFARPENRAVRARLRLAMRLFPSLALCCCCPSALHLSSPFRTPAHSRASIANEQQREWSDGQACGANDGRSTGQRRVQRSIESRAPVLKRGGERGELLDAVTSRQSEAKLDWLC